MDSSQNDRKAFIGTLMTGCLIGGIGGGGRGDFIWARSCIQLLFVLSFYSFDTMTSSLVLNSGTGTEISRN